MKNYTSRFLKSVALGYMGFPLIYVTFAALLFDVPSSFLIRILLTPSFYLLSFIAVAVGYGLWEMKRWAWYFFIACNILIGYENAVVVNEYSASHYKVIAFLASLFILWLLINRVAREIRVPYFFPKIRWWESNPRYKIAVPSALERVNQNTLPPYPGEILDLSIGGCFMKTRADVLQDEVVKVRFTAFGLPLDCQGIVVWRTQSTVTHPRGIGIKFASVDRKQRRRLRQVTRRLKKIAELYRRSRYLLSQEDFLKRLRELEADAPSDEGGAEVAGSARSGPT